MRLLSQLEIANTNGGSAIQLLHGDLAALPPEHEVDILIVSAFPGNYVPVPHTLIGALGNRGLDMYELAGNKQVNEVTQLGCWLSKELPPALQHTFNVKRIMCFEPLTQSNKPEETVSNVFRCLNNFVIPDIHTKETKATRKPFDISDIAMPMLAAGNQEAPVKLMLPAILSAASFWLSNGLPVKTLKLVVYNDNDAQPCKLIFEKFAAQWQQQQVEQKAAAVLQTINDTAGPHNWKQKITSRISKMIDEQLAGYILQDLYAVADEEEKPVIKKLFAKLEAQTQSTSTNYTSATEQYDYFISYAHAHNTEVQEFIDEFTATKSGLKIFYDRDSIPPGGLWIKNISDAIQNSKQVICILSPAYSSSDVCWDEFQCAKLKEYNTKQPVIKTISLYKDAALPPVMGIYSYIDCTEGDIMKLRNAVKRI